MASNIFNDLEELWDALLSQDARLIRAAYDSLGTGDQDTVLAHLRRMANEPGWQEQQRISAQAALEALAPGSKQV